MKSYSVGWYELPLRTPFPAGKEMVQVRRGAILRVEEGGQIGYGEIAPLAGLHRETLQDALEGVQEAACSGSMPMSPSAAFGLSCAQATMTHDRRFGFARSEHSGVGVNAVFSGDAAAASVAIERGDFTGFRTVKVKVGLGKVADDAALIRAMLDGLDPSVRLRLDGNRRLTLTSAARMMKRLDAGRIEYMEEPLRDPLELPELSRRTGIPMAIDESLYEPEHRESLVGAPGVEVQVIKPSLLGAVPRASRCRSSSRACSAHSRRSNTR
ncbi:MAG: o-succinylbenzoate synthase [Phycisphaerae bacterium]|nr:o-succinylbenzoate synthase [Phycisphaerae bacterium]